MFKKHQIHVLNSGWLPDSQEAVAALAYVAPQDGTYLFTAGEVTADIGCWPGRGNKPIKIWAEVDGVQVWPANGQPFIAQKDNEKTALPDILVALKKDSTLRYCVQGTTENGDQNNVYLDPVAYALGAYDQALDPTDGVERPTKPTTTTSADENEPTGDATEEPTQPADAGTVTTATTASEEDGEGAHTGDRLPAAALAAGALSLAAGGFLLRRKPQRRA